MAKGHPILGAIAGLFLGIFVAFDLTFFKVTTMRTPVLGGLMLLGLVLGLLFGFTAPFRRSRVRPAATE